MDPPGASLQRPQRSARCARPSLPPSMSMSRPRGLTTSSPTTCSHRSSASSLRSAQAGIAKCSWVHTMCVWPPTRPMSQAMRAHHCRWWWMVRALGTAGGPAAKLTGTWTRRVGGSERACRLMSADCGCVGSQRMRRRNRSPRFAPRSSGDSVLCQHHRVPCNRTFPHHLLMCPTAFASILQRMAPGRATPGATAARPPGTRSNHGAPAKGCGGVGGGTPAPPHDLLRLRRWDRFGIPSPRAALVGSQRASRRRRPERMGACMREYRGRQWWRTFQGTSPTRCAAAPEDDHRRRLADLSSNVCAVAHRRNRLASRRANRAHSRDLHRFCNEALRPRLMCRSAVSEARRRLGPTT